jgi:glycine oxidase
MTHFKVVGGGIIGMSIAWRLAQKGLAIDVFDAGRIGGEASWAGAGMLAPGGEIKAQSRWAELAVESLRLYPDFVRELEQESGLAIDFRQCGAIEKTNDETRAESQRALGIRSTRISPTELFYPDDAVVDPRHILQALRTACEHRGVVLHEHSPVRAIKGPAILAAGAWSSGIHTPVPIPPSFPIRGHLVSYRMSPGSQPLILRSGPTYVLQRATGLTIAGSNMERVGFDRAINPEIVADIDRRARELLPELPHPHESWLGFRPATESLEPEVGRLPGTDVFLAYGHYRNGILLAPITARLLADNISG